MGRTEGHVEFRIAGAGHDISPGPVEVEVKAKAGLTLRDPDQNLCGRGRRETPFQAYEGDAV
jgi:hypothetical protein